jgi:hypothetical protein
MNNHGVCACRECFELGKTIPARPWLVRLVQATRDDGLRVVGKNLSFPPAHPDRLFRWVFTRAQVHLALRDARYDATDAIIETSALVIMTMGSAAQELRLPAGRV